MGTTADKLNHLINTKEGIRQEINRAYNTEEISTSDTFNSYVQKLEEHPFYIMRYIERSIESIKLFNVTSIGDRSFYYCSNLTNASFPNATSIGWSAFSRCTSLTNVSFPAAVSILYWAFAYCSSLTSVSFPNVEIVSSDSFNSCTSLTSVFLPNVTSIQGNSFINCSSLTTIYVGTNTSTVCKLSNTSAFNNCTKLTNIYVPASLVDSYKSATNWSSYADKITAASVEPVECITLSITADDVAAGNITSTTVYYTAECTYKEGGILQEGTRVFTGKGTSNSFEQNTSTTDTVQREVSFTFLGKTATTTITQGMWISSGGGRPPAGSGGAN